MRVSCRGAAPSPGTELIPHVDLAFLARRPLPIHPLLLAGYAVLFLYASNLSEVDLDRSCRCCSSSSESQPRCSWRARWFSGIRPARRSCCRRLSPSSSATATWSSSRPVPRLPVGQPRHSGSSSASWPWSRLARWRALRTATRAFNALGFGLVLVALIAIVPYELGQFTAASAAARLPGLACPCRPAPGQAPGRCATSGSSSSTGTAPRIAAPQLRDRGAADALARGSRLHVTPDAHATSGRRCRCPPSTSTTSTRSPRV